MWNLRRTPLAVLALVLWTSAACAQSQAPGPVTAVPAQVASPLTTAIPPNKPEHCADVQRGKLQDINDTSASPYFVHHPSSDLAESPTVIFIPGGAGLRRNAQRAWESYLSEARAVESFRIIIPYSANLEFLEEFSRTFEILDEVLACYGGDPAQVHVAGFSNGGLAAFALMLQRPDRFTTLLGAPGEFAAVNPREWAKALAGKSVFNGVGENDNDWKPEVKETHDALVSVGIDSVYGEFPGQGHSARDGFDKNVLFDFWTKHSSMKLTDALAGKDNDCR